MAASRASEEQNLTPSGSSQSDVLPFSPVAEFGSQAFIFAADVRWIMVTAFVYCVAVIVTVLTLHPYFAQMWDVVTFVKAGQTAFSPDWAALYAQSHLFWPYAYPPLPAFVIAPFVALAGLFPAWLMVRVPPLLFDIALGILLYEIVGQKTRDKHLARLALAVCLLNPVTWYATAAQGHFEAEWLFFVVLAYWLIETRRGWIAPAIVLAVAFLFKQNALLFALVFWVQLFKNREQDFSRRVLCVFFFALPIVLVSLPFLLYSNDYWFLTVRYVADLPLQTQSWLVALASMFSPDFLILRVSSLLVLMAALAISVLAMRRGFSLWLSATLIGLAFFLLSKKVVGYYYVMILPFALVTLIPRKQFRVLSLVVVAISFISLSPYFASWAEPRHWRAYAILGTLNSLLWLGMFVWMWRKGSELRQTAAWPVQATMREMKETRELGFISVALFFAAVAAALLQPLVNSQTSPIRAPMIPNGLELLTLFVFVVFAVLVGVALVLASLYSRTLAHAPPVSGGWYAIPVLFAPLYFLTFTLTKESTAAFELLLHRLAQ
jgi:hypothetical protein